ncbi:agmatine deiminase family protein [Hoyosella sp. YIM 151337]|uniref:agmatine deiminase family protein n=1 Tax=Hoyosella sp. YIM 151337 TaxID=2992742 RepID=UPI0022362036|nr:agmatine deiminase family protein [Hoyosella sp. YIM 151337]MCW4355443.1 agmatine deiminase family protein [Hoyosella sp. YIM 151337]
MTPRMPAESEPHARTWMAYPREGYSLGDTQAERHEARSAWAAVANAIVDFEPVTVVVDPAELTHARHYLAGAVEIVEAPLNDAWMRDIGPTFVLGSDGRPRAVNWVFNGWGAQDWARWDKDEKIGAFVAEQAGALRVDSPLVNEGGGIQTDGAGTVLVTETVQLDQGRNPGWTKAGVEAELARTIGAEKVIWLPRGLTRDFERFGTRGHVDIVAAIPSAGRVLVHDQRDPAHPDHAVSQEAIALLSQSVDASGRTFTVVPVPAPKILEDDEGWTDYSYINHYVANGAVIACMFDDPNDQVAADILADAYPGREIVPVDARPIFSRGGGIHCITQNEPAAQSVSG